MSADSSKKITIVEVEVQRCCLLCNKHFTPNGLSSSADSTKNNSVVYNKTVFRTFDKHLSVSVKGNSFCWSSTENENTPFCSTCMESAEKLIQIDKEMEEIKKRLENLINSLSIEILTTKGLQSTNKEQFHRNQNSENYQDKSQYSLETTQLDSEAGEIVVTAIKPEPEDQEGYFSDHNIQEDQEDHFSDHNFEDDNLNFSEDPLSFSEDNIGSNYQLKSENFIEKETSIKKEIGINGELVHFYPQVLLTDINGSASGPGFKKKKSAEVPVRSLRSRPILKRKAAVTALNVLRNNIKAEMSARDSEDEEDPLIQDGLDSHSGNDNAVSDIDEYDSASGNDEEMSDFGRREESKKTKYTDKSRKSKKKANTSERVRKVGFNCAECVKFFSFAKDLDQHSKESGHVNEKSHKCEYCDKSYYRREDLKYHLRNHPADGTSNFTCGICGLQVTTHGGFKNHLKTHAGGDFFDCDSCFMKFLTESQLEKHKLIHKDPEQSSFPCPVCNQEFKSKLSLRNHNVKHEKKPNDEKNNSKSFQCGHCDESFDFSKELIEHSEATGHINEKKFVCTFGRCTNRYFRKLDLKYHARTHGPAKRGRYRCGLCTRRFRNSLAYKNHLATHSGETFDCDECDYKCTNEKTFKEHQNIHTGETPFSCGNCEKAFHTNEDLMHHVNTTHGRKSKYGCEHCGATFFSETTLLTHSYAHTGIKPFKCEVENCTSSFTTKRKMQVHFIKRHTTEKPFVCDQPNCDKAYKFKRLLEDHILMHTDPVAAKRYICEQCGKGFAHSDTLRTHKKMHGSKKFYCEICGKSFFYKDSLNKHLKRGHDDNKPIKARTWPCGLCNVVCPTPSSFAKHERTHTGEKPYQCEECGVAYATRGTLTMHMNNVHLGLRFGCDHCEKSFSTKKSQRDHQKIHLRLEKTFQCTICKQEFPDKKELTTHQKTSHSDHEKRFKCTNCNTGFTKGTNYKIHIAKCGKAN